MHQRSANTQQIALIALLVAVLGFGATQIFRLGQDVRDQLGHQAASDADNIQWNLIQGEVELLQLQVAIERALLGEAQLDTVKQRYDIFFSRVETLTNSSLYRGMFRGTVVQEHLDQVTAFRDRWVSVIDGPEAVLVEELPAFSTATIAARAEMRRVTVEAVRRHAQLSDQRRVDIRETLVSLGATALVLVLWLVCVVLLLLGMYRRLRRVSQENENVRGRLEAMVTSSLDAILVMDRSGQIIDTNGAAAFLFGMDPAEIKTRTVWDLLQGETVSDLNKNTFLYNTARASAPDKERTRVIGIGAAGNSFPAEISVSVTRSGGASVYVAFLRDVSKRVAREAELLRARDEAVSSEKAKGRMLSIMSHEMRTPLNGVLGALNLLDDQGVNQEQKKFLDAIRVSSDVLLHHVNDVLDLSRLGAGELVRQDKVFEPEPLISSLVDSQRPVAEAAGNTLEFISALPSGAFVRGDARLLQNALLNLVGNAIKFTANGQVLVEIDRIGQSDMLEIRVSDTGQGIAEEDLDRVFEEFVTVDASYARETEGTGLGLSITSKLVEAMGGTIGVESIVGEGSLFWMRLPLPIVASAPRQRSNERDANQPTHGQARILIVEDNDINRMLLSELLEKDGHYVVPMESGAAGVRAAQDELFDIVFMDISMPGLDGFQAAEQIRSTDQNASTPIIAITAHAPDTLRRDKRTDVFTDIIGKPFSVSDIRHALMTATKCAEGDEPTRDRLPSIAAVLGEDRLAEMLRAFRAEIEAFLDLNADWAETRNTAHRLAGSAATFGCSKLHSALLEVEASGTPSHDRIEAVRAAWAEEKCAVSVEGPRGQLSESNA